MSILINKDTKVITQGITGKTGQFHTEKCQEYALRNNTAEQMGTYLAEICSLHVETNPEGAAVAEVQQAIQSVKSGRSRSVQLSPQDATLRKVQHEMVREAELLSRSSGTEPRRHVTVYANH